MPRPPETPLWRRTSLDRLLRRPVYAGDAVIRARRDISGRLWPQVATKDAHPAIVPRALFDAVQRRFREPTGIVRQTLVSPLSGLLWCAACGSRIYAVEQNRPNRPTNLRIARCAAVSESFREGMAVTCPGLRHSIALGAVELLARQSLRALLTEALLSPDRIAAHVAAERAAVTHDDAPAKARVRLADIERRRSRLLDAYESGALDLMTWQARDRLLGADAANLAEVIASAPVIEDLSSLLAVRETFATLDMDRLDERAVLTELGARVSVDMDARAVTIEPAYRWRHLFG